MVEIKPFRATILNPELANRDELICPVYDTIDDAQYRRYSLRRDNVIHFTTRRRDMSEHEFVRYARANLERMFNERILIECEKPALYIYGISYKLSSELMNQIPEENRRETYFASGLVALVKLEKLNDHLIFGHENTFESNTDERYRLMKGCGMNFAPVVAAYKMPHHEINRIFEHYIGSSTPMSVPEEPVEKKPLVDVSLNGSRHLLWALSDEGLIEEIQQLMLDRKIMILDGHHRYTASYWLSKCGGGGSAYAYTLMMLLEADDNALLLLPWHRCLRRCHMHTLWEQIKSNFYVEPCGRDEIYAKLRECNDGDFDVRVCMYDRENFYLLRADERKIRALSERRGERVGLDVISLHEWLIEPALGGEPAEELIFTASPGEAIEGVNNGTFRVAFFLKPPKMADVEYKAMVEKKELPQKSTLFLPKVAEGVVMRRFQRD